MNELTLIECCKSQTPMVKSCIDLTIDFTTNHHFGRSGISTYNSIPTLLNAESDVYGIDIYYGVQGEDRYLSYDRLTHNPVRTNRTYKNSNGDYMYIQVNSNGKILNITYL